MENKSLDLMKRMGMINENNFLKEYYPNTFNNAQKCAITEVNAKNLIDKHSKDGYIIISPCRGYDDFNLDSNNPNDKQKLAEINKKRIREFIDILKKTNFSYTPVYGGFIENKGEDTEEQVYERSFIVYVQDRTGKVNPIDNLYNFGIEMCNKFNQDSFLFKAPNDAPKYINKNGDVDMTFKNNMSFNDISQLYFTDLHKNTNKFTDMDKRSPTRFTFELENVYINPSSQCLTEAHCRFLSNEIALSYKH